MPKQASTEVPPQPGHKATDRYGVKWSGTRDSNRRPLLIRSRTLPGRIHSKYPTFHDGAYTTHSDMVEHFFRGQDEKARLTNEGNHEAIVKTQI